MDFKEQNNFEKYIFAEDKDEFLKTLVVGTDQQLYLSAQNLINSTKFDNLSFSAQDLETIQQAIDRFGQKTYSQNLKQYRNTHEFDLKMLLQQLQSKQLKEKQQIIQTIQEYYAQINYSKYQKPADIKASDLLSIEQEHLSLISEDEQSIEKILQQAYQKIGIMEQMHSNLLLKLDINKIVQSSNEIILFYFQNIELFALSNEELLILIQVVDKNNKLELQQHYDFQEEYFYKMTQQQLEYLQETIPWIVNKQIVSALFLKQFNKKLNDLPFSVEGDDFMNSDIEELQELREQAEKMYNFAKNKNYAQFSQLKQQILIEILLLDSYLNNYKQDLFLQFLSDAIYGRSMLNYNSVFQEQINEENYEILMQDNYFLHSIHKCMKLQHRQKDPDLRELCLEYLQEFFKTAKSIQPFDQYLDQQYLIEIFYKTKLLQGEAPKHLEKQIAPALIDKWRNESEITISKHNCKYFRQNDPVKIAVDLKNIQMLTINTYEINLENYFRENLKLQWFDATLSLEGIVPTEQQKFTQNEQPSTKTRKIFEFKSIAEKQRGTFIVEFVGGGFSSRQIIYKGLLTFLSNESISGHIITIISEDQQLCIQNKNQKHVQNKSQAKTGLWLKGRFHQANEKGQVVIPYADEQEDVKLILVHDDYAEIVDFCIQKEKYDFKCAFIYQEEQFLEGGKAKILIQPRLYINNMPANMMALEDPIINVVTKNHLDIPSTYRFPGLNFNSKQELEILVPIKNMTKKISIQVLTSTRTLKDKKIDLEQNHEINFNLYQNVNTFTNIYLKNTQAGYILNLLGKNGEPKPANILKVTLHFLHSTYRQSFDLKTDHNGEIQLGKLNHISKIEVIQAQSPQNGIGIQQTDKIWNIDDRYYKIDYPEQITSIENDVIVLPMPDNEDVTRDHIEFYQYQEFSIIKNCINHAKIQDHRLVLQGLKEGNYLLKLKDLELSSGNLSNNLGIKETIFMPVQSDKDLVNIRSEVMLPDNAQTPGMIEYYRAHLFAFTFQEKNIFEMVEKIRNNNSLQQPQNTFFLLGPSDIFNNKALGDETNYVLARQTQQKFIGNPLEKPSILLKRTEVRETHFEKENLNAEKDYKQKKIQQRSKQEKNFLLQRPHSSEDIAIYQNGISSFQNFLQNSSFCETNIPISKQGVLTVKNFPYKKYSTILIVLTNLEATVCNLYPLEVQNNIQTKDIRLKSSLNLLKDYSMQRSNIVVGTNEITVISQDSENVIIENMQQFFDIQKQLKLAQHQNDNEQKDGYKFWEFLQNWHALPKKQQLEKYNEYACHEVNLFLYLKDPDFFQNVCLPFLKNKIEKTFFDHFLLGNQSEIIVYANSNKFDELNALEQVLLIISLVKTDKKRANSFALKLQNQQKLSKFDQNLYNLLFDTVLSTKETSYQNKQYKNEAIQKEEENSSISRNIQQKQNIQEIVGDGDSSDESQTSQLVIINNQIESPRNYSRNNKKKYNIEIEQFKQIQTLKQLLNQQKNHRCMKDSKYSDNVIERSCLKEEEDQEEEDIQYLRSKQSGQCSRVQEVQEQNFSAKFKLHASNAIQFFNQDISEKMVQQKKQYIPGFQNVDKTKEYIERTYYSSKSKNNQTKIMLNQFWVDLALFVVNSGSYKNFISPNIIYCTRNHAEMLVALAFTALTPEKSQYEMKVISGRRIQIEAKNDNLLIFYKSINISQSNIQGDITVAQRFFDPSDRYQIDEEDPDVQIEKPVQEFVTNKIYGSQIIITNCSVASLQFQILREIPDGSIPVNNIEYIQSISKYINSYQTVSFEFFFYFPQPGKYFVYPANVSREGIVLSKASNSNQFIIVSAQKQSENMITFRDILQKGSKNDILQFCQERNIMNPQIFDFNDIYWLLLDQEFYQKFLQILKSRSIFNQTVWQFSFKHQDIASILEYLSSTQGQQFLKLQKIKYLKTQNLYFNDLKIFEYHPLLSNRIHNFMDSAKNKILNIQFKETYFQYLQYLIQVPTSQIHSYHLIVLCYYLLLSDRLEEGIEVFSRIQPLQVQDKQTQLQCDYLAVYLNMYDGYPNFLTARQIVEKYLQYPVLSWRNMFLQLKNQLDEYDGDQVQQGQQNLQQNEFNKNLAQSELQESISFELYKTELNITYSNLKNLSISFYVLDLEVLFSRSPFILQEQTQQFSYVKPNEIIVPNIQNSNLMSNLIVKIPKNLENKNLFISISANTKKLHINYFSQKMKVHIIDNYGQVKVTDLQNLPLSKVYVKCYLKDKTGNVLFFRDGYTDLRGRFDYAQSSAIDIDSVDKFSLLIKSEQYGSIIKEAQKPSQLGSMAQTL